MHIYLIVFTIGRRLRIMVANSSPPIHDRYLDDSGEIDPALAWLGGYFHTSNDDAPSATERLKEAPFKNVDFLRLRDVPLHAVEAYEGRKILDVGCSNGATMVYMGLQGAQVFGQDLDAREVDRANAMLKRFNLQGEAKVGDAKRLAFDDNTFDAVISSDFMEHITNDEKVAVLKESLRVLKPGGRLVTKTPNRNYLNLSLWYKRARAITRFENPMRYVIPHTPGTPDPEHIGLATRTEFTQCLIAAGVLNYSFVYVPLRRFGASPMIELLSTEVPLIRDYLCEDLFCVAYKPIAYSHFPE